ncbi:MAG: hypothetical protein GY832_11790 [Chloroflexi bacterium]|nr:hypothetical protein [Chloroflexota bacterium]
MEHVKGVSGVSLGDVYQAVRALERKLESGTIAIRTGTAEGETWDEDPELAAALTGLGEMGLDC